MEVWSAVFFLRLRVYLFIFYVLFYFYFSSPLTAALKFDIKVRIQEKHKLQLMLRFILISFLLFPLISDAQVEWTEFSIRVLSSQLDEREICINFPNEQTFDLVEFDRLVQGSVTVKINSEIILTHSGESVDAVQSYPVIFSTNRVCILYSTNEDFWIRFQISN